MHTAADSGSPKERPVALWQHAEKLVRLWRADPEAVTPQKLDRLVEELAARQRKLEARNADLERTVAERTTELATRMGEVADLSEQRRKAVLTAQQTEERERRALAQDLHDSIGQLLALARMKLADVPDDPDGAVAETRALIDQVGDRVRTLTLRISPPSLHELGLLAATEELVAEMSHDFGLDVEVTTGGSSEVPLGEDQRSVLFRGLRELLINVARHADVRSAGVRFDWEADEVHVTVEDGGNGFDPDAPAGGFGLTSLGARLRTVGGRLELEAIPGDGTTARMVLPYSPPEREPR